MSIQDMIKKSVLESGVFDSFNAPKMAISLIVALLLGAVIYMVYSKFYVGVIFSRSFAVTLVGMTLLTFMVTLAISTNIVISLGMVGALSIVRFRTAIKDPMDLVFMFWSISIGIICGAGLYEVALVTSVAVTVFILVLDMIPVSKAPMMLVINSSQMDGEQQILDIVGKYARYYKVKSRNLSKGRLDMVVELRVKDESALVSEVAALEGMIGASLIAHDGEVTF